jgi:hypothetical protein
MFRKVHLVNKRVEGLTGTQGLGGTAKDGVTHTEEGLLECGVWNKRRRELEKPALRVLADDLHPGEAEEKEEKTCHTSVRIDHSADV